MAISVGSVEVDVIPNTQGIYQRLRDGLVPAATRAGEDAGRAAGRSFGPALQAQIGDVGLRIGEEIGQQIANRLTASLRDALREGITQAGRAAQPAAARQGDETAGAFSRTLKARLEVAFRSLPKLQVGADTSEADADLQALRVRMETLADKRIGIDISAEDAKAEIRLIEAELTRLGAEHPNVQVRADTATALAQLAAVRAEIDAVDGKTARIDIDTSGAMSAIFQLSIAIAGLAVIPAIPVLAAGLGAFTAATVAAGVGVGALAAVAVPALSGIKNALTAQKAAQDAATTATTQGGQAASQAASKALQMAGAQQALAAAHRNAARQIADAQRGVSDAVRQAAQANEQAAAQVKAARQAVADAVQQAADRQQQATERVQQAEQALVQAQRGARQAQLDLTQARAEATRQLEDMNNQLADAQLAQRSAILQVQQAKQSLDAVLANPAASDLQRAQAQLSYDEAIQHLKEQQLATQRLQKDTAAANKAGVEGSTTVKSAQDRLAQAQQDVTDKTTALRKAQTDAAKTQVQNARQIADAQAKLAAAQKNVAAVQQQGAEAVAKAQERLVQAQEAAADAIASAERQIQSAQLSTAASAGKAATAQEKYEQALAKLSPAARAAFDAFTGLRSAFTQWSQSLQPAVLPLFTRALEGLRNSLPSLTPFVLAAARAVQTLQDRVSAGFKSPWWQGFKQDLAGSVEPALVGLGISFGQVFKGMTGIVQAFLPHMDAISARMQRITGRFANWGSSLKGSPAFERFLAYASELAPRLASTLGKIADAFLKIGEALSPLSGPALAAVGAIADAVGWLATNLPGVVQWTYALFIFTRLWSAAQLAVNAAVLAYQGLVILATLLTSGWAAAIEAANLAFETNPIVAVVTIIIAALALLVAGIIYAWNHWAWFRDAVLAVWTAIQVAVAWVWTTVLQPVFSAIWAGLQAVGTAALWLWTSAIQPAFSFIWTAARVLLAIVAVAVLAPLYLAFQLVGAIAMWLWTDAIQPAFQLIAAIALWLWHNAFEPMIDGIVTDFRYAGRIGMWLYEEALKPAFQFIAALALWLWHNIIEPAFNGISGTISDVWRDDIRPTFNSLKASLGDVADAFDTGVGYMGRAWAKLKDLTRTPVQFIVDTVYNNGIVKVWNAVADLVDLGHLNPVKFATGGTVPGFAPRQDTVPALLSPGEGVLVPETVRALGGAPAIAALNSWGRSGVQRFADGGIVDDIWGGITGAAKTIGGWAGSAGDIISDPGSIWEKAIAPIVKKVAQVGDNRWAQALGKVPLKAISGLKDKLVNGVKDAFGNIGAITGGGGSGVARWTGVVQQALRMLGQPLSYTGITLRRMEQESGGDPTIVNKWDSNWIAGTPSVGLMQVIGPTFDAYAGSMRNVGPKLYGVSVNPLANIIASMRYALAAYGSLPAAYNRAGGYDSGGYLQPGLNLAYNGTGRPEPVFTTQQASALMHLATDPGAGVGDLHVQVYVGDREITDIARAEVRRSNGELVQTLRAGRR
ncbi:hypothetical protein [Streptomyces ehimensis]|uniref:Transglycosylase SLT domain-containing protein n=1 Tax=Streptomyces ehimensis TaxID=68195 RepID=A0ABV9BER8_9ACTN